MEWVFGWLFSAFAAAALAQLRGEKYMVTWFIIGAVLGPLGFLVALVRTGRPCPACKSRVHESATRCPRCHSELAPEEIPVVTAPRPPATAAPLPREPGIPVTPRRPPWEKPTP